MGSQQSGVLQKGECGVLGREKSGQIKSRERVSKFAEVFTAEREVKAMCDMIPDWSGNVLEPACGTGNFLVEVAKRKLAMGMTAEETARTLYGIDIQADNVEETIQRLLALLPDTEQVLRTNIVCGDFLHTETVWFLKGLLDDEVTTTGRSRRGRNRAVAGVVRPKNKAGHTVQKHDDVGRGTAGGSPDVEGDC